MHAVQSIETSRILNHLRNENPSNVIFFLLNLNFIFYKFEHLKFFYMNSVDTLLIGKTKLDSFFPDAQFFY